MGATAGGYGQLTACALESACEGNGHIKVSEGDEAGIVDSTFSTTADGSSEGDEGESSFSSLASTLEEVASMPSGTVWMPDEAVQSCFKCEASFTFLRRR